MTLRPEKVLAPGDALLVVDVQNDFCPGGRLPIESGDAVIPVLNAWMARAHEKGLPIYASRDWHPHAHVSFDHRDGPWPPHCVQDTEGAAFHPELQLPPEAIVVTKGTRFDKDQNSAFDETGLAHDLRTRGIRRVWIGGLALDVCVLASALEARKAGFEVHVILPGSRAISDESARDAVRTMREKGIHVEDDA